MSLSPLRVIGIVLHLVVAVAAIGLLHQQYRQRQIDVAQVQAAAQHERAETQRVENEVAVQQQILGGIREGDPFVVEMLARERLDLTRPGEITPPPAAQATPSTR